MIYTPDRITSLLPNEVFVFGSNWAGRHGKGAALQAVKFGAIAGKGVGLMGHAYGIATKDYTLNVLPLQQIEQQVAKFLAFASVNSKLRFLVTPIGCGLAGYSPDRIAPLFWNYSPTGNVILPECFYL